MVGFENRIFRKSFLFDHKKEALTIEIHFHSYFHFKWFPERERERRESPDHAFDITDEPRAPIQRSHAPDYTGLVNHSIVPIAPRRSISPSTHRSLSLCDFDFCCCCSGVVVVFWWLWLLIARVCCRGLNWSFGGMWCWDLAMICSVDWDLAVILKFSVIKFVWMLRK